MAISAGTAKKFPIFSFKAVVPHTGVETPTNERKMKLKWVTRELTGREPEKKTKLQNDC